MKQGLIEKSHQAGSSFLFKKTSDYSFKIQCRLVKILANLFTATCLAEAEERREKYTQKAQRIVWKIFIKKDMLLN